MNREELLKYYAELEYSEYATKYLLPYWAEKAKNFKDTYQSVLSDNFFNNHTVGDSTITRQKAEALYDERNYNRRPLRESTLVSKDLLINVLTAIQKKGIIDHLCKVSKVFTNYKLNPDTKGVMIAVYRDSNDNKVVKQFSDSCIVGINPNGLVTHFHGDASYGSLIDVYDTGTDITHIRKTTQ